MAGAGASLEAGLHFSQTLPSLAALTQQGCWQCLPAFSAFSQQPPVLNLVVSTAGAASFLAGAAVVVAAMASEEQTATRARRRSRDFMWVNKNCRLSGAHQALFDLPHAKKTDNRPKTHQSRHGKSLLIEKPPCPRGND